MKENDEIVISDKDERANRFHRRRKFILEENWRNE